MKEMIQRLDHAEALFAPWTRHDANKKVRHRFKAYLGKWGNIGERFADLGCRQRGRECEDAGVRKEEISAHWSAIGIIFVSLALVVVCS